MTKKMINKFRILISIMFQFFTASYFAQDVKYLVLSDENRGIWFIENVSFRIDFTSKNEPNVKYYIKSSRSIDSIKVEKKGIIFTPSEEGGFFLQLYKIVKKDTFMLKQKNCFALKYPEPTAIFGNKSYKDTTITMIELTSAKTLHTINKPLTSVLNIKESSKIVSYQIIINQNEIINIKNIDDFGTLSKDILERIQRLSVNDTICFRNIVVQLPFGKVVTINPIILKIKS